MDSDRRIAAVGCRRIGQRRSGWIVGDVVRCARQFRESGNSHRVLERTNVSSRMRGRRGRPLDFSL